MGPAWTTERTRVDRGWRAIVDPFPGHSRVEREIKDLKIILLFVSVGAHVAYCRQGRLPGGSKT
jgi:hypothetical protein